VLFVERLFSSFMLSWFARVPGYHHLMACDSGAESTRNSNDFEDGGVGPVLRVTGRTLRIIAEQVGLTEIGGEHSSSRWPRRVVISPLWAIRSVGMGTVRWGRCSC